ncbi:type VII toxin-antitoxin system MntA family adenylyltransferase antitoxin [Desulfovermiculus halophilus]|jgi:predicted nucleotidyltransferase|uniref:type VII toxin-antitoxin system MntA family adenylyltransferase antitoxin n=1 Tax=Desulfovermiculus halophilus TaxID=339722 RepID=UPI0009FFADDF|nr:nucleotidyltransferase domain-containing protein [Desulfovermiculus halophilus]
MNRVEDKDIQLYEFLQENYSDIVLAYLFGSRVAGHISPQSDYDFAILLDRDADKAVVRSSLASDLAGLLHSSRIDVVILNNAPIDLSFAVISQGQILYEQSVEARVDFEAKVMGMYFDYLPFLKRSRDDILREDPYAARVLRYRKAFGRTQRTLGQIRTAESQKTD